MSRRRFYKPKRNLNRIRHLQQKPQVDTSVVRRIISAVFFIAALIWFAYFFLFSDNFLIKEVNIAGNENIPIQELKKVVQDNLSKKRWLIFPNKNILLFSKDELISDINKMYIVDSINIDKDLPFRLNIKIQEKLSRLILRTKTLVQVEEEEPTYTIDYFYLDVNGIIVSHGNVTDKDLATLPIIEMRFDSQTHIKPSDMVMDHEKVEYIYSVYEQIGKSKANLELDYIVYNPDIKDELTFVTKEGWQGFLSSKISLETQIKKLELALDEKIKENRANLQYVDLRVKDRVYFK